MADKEHLRIINQGVDAWNEWRRKNPQVRPDFSKADLGNNNLIGADLSGADLFKADLNRADLSEANLSKAELSHANLNVAHFFKANLSGANFTRADLSMADLSVTNLSKADLSMTNLYEANLSKADLSMAELLSADLSDANLSGANLSGASLSFATLSGTNFENADLTDCNIFAISAWNLKINEKTKQSNLRISRLDEPSIMVDDLEVAQFISLLLHNEKIRHVIDTITSKIVLILGRFSDERKAVLDAIRDELRKRDYLPILFDFDKPASRDLTETISTLAHMARFIIADITEPRSIPQELQRVVPDLPSVPIQPLLLGGATEYGMFEHFKKYPWVLAIHRYRDLKDLLSSLKEKVIEPAEAKVKELREGKVK